MSATVIEAQDGASRVVRARATVASFTAARYAVILADPPWEYTGPGRAIAQTVVPAMRR